MSDDAFCFRPEEVLQENIEDQLLEEPVINKGVLMQELDQLQMDEFNDFCGGIKEWKYATLFSQKIYYVTLNLN